MTTDALSSPGAVARPDTIPAHLWDRMPWPARARAAARHAHQGDTPTPGAPTVTDTTGPPPAAAPEPPAEPEPVTRCQCGAWTVNSGDCHHHVGPDTTPPPTPVWLITAHANRPQLHRLARLTGGHITHPHPTRLADYRRRRTTPITP